MSYPDYYSFPTPKETKPKILVIEDSPDLQILLFEVLETKGFQVLLAADGNIGLWMAEEQLPSLILTDVGLPGLNGYKVFRALRQNPITSAIPVIFCTGEEEEYSMHSERIEANAFLPKPVNIDMLLKTVNACLV